MDPAQRLAFPAEDWLRALLRQLAAQGLRDLERMREAPDAAIHDLRVRMKKLRAVLRLGKTAANKTMLSAIDHHCRAIKNSYGAQRDDMVLQRLCQKHFHEALPASAEIRAADRTPEHGQRELLALDRELERLPLAGLEWKQVLANYRKTWRSAKKRMRRWEDHQDPHDLHPWRKRVKQLYFQSLALIWLKGAKKRIRRARKLGSRLGRDHDLAGLISRLSGADGWQERKNQLEKRRRRKHPRLRRLGRKLFKHRLRPKRRAMTMP